MTVPLRNKQQAETEAVRLAAAALAGVDFSVRGSRLGLPAPQPDGRLPLRFLGRDLLVVPPEFQVVTAVDAQPVKPADRILTLHYLQCDHAVAPSGELISFHDFPGGQFYYSAFIARSTEPLVRRIGNDLDLLRRQLPRYDWQPVPLGDLAARIHVLGRLEVTLVYNAGDEELPPQAQFLFDACIKRVYGAEDAAVLASRVCLGLL